MDAYVLVFIHLGSRRVFMSPATFNPHEKWVLQQARNASMLLGDIGVNVSHLIRDRDTKFTARFEKRVPEETLSGKKVIIKVESGHHYCPCVKDGKEYTSVECFRSLYGSARPCDTENEVQDAISHCKAIIREEEIFPLWKISSRHSTDFSAAALSGRRVQKYPVRPVCRIVF